MQIIFQFGQPASLLSSKEIYCPEGHPPINPLIQEVHKA